MSWPERLVALLCGVAFAILLLGSSVAICVEAIRWAVSQ